MDPLSTIQFVIGRRVELLSASVIGIVGAHMLNGTCTVKLPTVAVMVTVAALWVSLPSRYATHVLDTTLRAFALELAQLRPLVIVVGTALKLYPIIVIALFTVVPDSMAVLTSSFWAAYAIINTLAVSPTYMLQLVL